MAGIAALVDAPGVLPSMASKPDSTDRPRPVGFDVADWRGGGGSLALDPPKPARGRPPLDDEHRGRLVEVGVHHLGDVGVEAGAVRSLGDRPGSDRPAGDLRLARPLRRGALNRVDRGTVQGEPRIPAQIRLAGTIVEHDCHR
jgi:hypothetical protein